MTSHNARTIINFLGDGYGVGQDKISAMSDIAIFLDEPISSVAYLCESHGFEMSFVDGGKSIRLLHLFFPPGEMSIDDKRKVLEDRNNKITSIFNTLKSTFGYTYNIPALFDLFNFNKKPLFPIQIGLECQKNAIKAKVYLSCNADYFPLDIFCEKFNLDYGILKNKFKNKKFDTVAVDFMPNGDIFFKFYPLVENSKAGLLCRVDRNSNILSIKKWRRYHDGLSGDDKIISDFIKLPVYLKDFMIYNQCKVHYICDENGKKSVYLR